MLTNYKWFLAFLAIISVLSVRSDDKLPCQYNDSIDVSSGKIHRNLSITFNGQTFDYGLYTLIEYKMDGPNKVSVDKYPRACIFNDTLPCRFFEAMNITDGVKAFDGSIVYDHMEFPVGSYATINYELLPSVKDNVTYYTRQSTPEYIRGCVCNRRDCIRLCCSKGKIFTSKGCVKHSKADEIVFPIRMTSNHYETVVLNKHFHYVTGSTCAETTFGYEGEFELDRVSFSGKVQRKFIL